MALSKAKKTAFGIQAHYWRFSRLAGKKVGGDGMGLSADLSLYLDKASSDAGGGAFETVQIVLPEPLPIWQEPDAVYPVSVDQVRYALGIILTYLYERVQAGEYELADDEQNYFADAEKV